MYLLRLIALDNLVHNRKISVKYIKSKENSRSDALSRLDFKGFIKDLPEGMDAKYVELPSQIWPASRIWQL